MVNSYLLDVLGKQSLDTSPWAMNHASVTPTDEAFLMARKNEYRLYLTTPRMLLGVDVSNLQQVVMLRPPNMEHAVVQVGSTDQYLNNFHHHRRWVGLAGSLQLERGLVL